MNYLPMDKLGAQFIAPGVIQFGIFFPGVDLAKGYSVSILISHEADQFLQGVAPVAVAQSHSLDPVYGDFWYGQINLNTASKPANSKAFGTKGRYVYRYLVHSPNPARGDIDYIIDPFAREVGVGRVSAITFADPQPSPFSPNETKWKTPALADCIVYELMISEFRGDLYRTINLIPYLADLGVNCIEVMPLSNVLATIDWGYDPIGHFCVAERFGSAGEFQKLVDAAHQNGIAVIVDSVYGHTGDDFAYNQLYDALGGDLPNPFIGPFAMPTDQKYGDSADFSDKLTQDYYYSVNQYWLDQFHVDGFRYDDVPEYWDGPTGVGYASLAYTTYQYIKSKKGATDHYQRFFDAAGNVNLIQIAEYLPAPPDILNQSYSTGTWQNGTLSAAINCAKGASGAISQLGYQLGLVGYPATLTTGADTILKTAMQYIENHDHQRFICNFGLVTLDNLPEDKLIQQGNRDANWAKVQPYLIAILTAKGTPLLAEGQEICENYWIDESGQYGRVMLYRPVRWNYFYDDIGQAIIRLVRKLTGIRKSGVQFRAGQHYFYDDFNNFNSKGLLAFSRQSGNTFSLVVVNFTNQDQSTSFTFPIAGNYTEQIEGSQNLIGVIQNAATPITIPSNYGCIWTIN
jgi:maltooligosyltrehalose trehalohydrolase